MPKRKISRFSARGGDPWSAGDVKGAIDELPELTAAQRKSLVYALRPLREELGDADFDELERIRRAFFLATSRRLNATRHTIAQRRVEEFYRGAAAFLAVLERDEPIDELILAAIAHKMGGRPGSALAFLPRLREIVRAAEHCAGGHRRAHVDNETPFEGLIAELAVWWRSALSCEPAASNSAPGSRRRAPAAPASPFAVLVYALMMTLRPANRMHVANVEPAEPDTWGALNQAIIRALQATRELQTGGLALRLAWALGHAAPYRRPQRRSRRRVTA